MQGLGSKRRDVFRLLTWAKSFFCLPKWPGPGSPVFVSWGELLNSAMGIEGSREPLGWGRGAWGWSLSRRRGEGEGDWHPGRTPEVPTPEQPLCLPCWAPVTLPSPPAAESSAGSRGGACVWGHLLTGLVSPGEEISDPWGSALSGSFPDCSCSHGLKPGAVCREAWK